MISANRFTIILEEISHKVRKLAAQNNSINFGYILSCAVAFWCCKLQFPTGASVYVINLSNEIQYLTKDIWDKWKQKIGLINKEDSEFKKYINSQINNKMGRNIDDLRFIILIAFVVTGVGYALYLLNQQSTEEEARTRNCKSPPDRLPHSYQERESWNLVLVINAGRENILQPLKTNGRITNEVSESLYRATQALWMGAQSDFSQFSRWFSGDRAVPEANQSEYDVYLVQIELDSPNPGFKPNANQIDRHDAFRSLHKNSGRAIVSPRISSKAYENASFYSR